MIYQLVPFEPIDRRSSSFLQRQEFFFWLIPWIWEHKRSILALRGFFYHRQQCKQQPRFCFEPCQDSSWFWKCWWGIWWRWFVWVFLRSQRWIWSSFFWTRICTTGGSVIKKRNFLVELGIWGLPLSIILNKDLWFCKFS